MTTIGGFAALTERAKDVIVTQLRTHFSLLASQNVISEQPTILKYGLDGQAAQNFLNIFTTLPHEVQRIPTIAVMSAPVNERKMGIGRQVVATFRDPVTNLPLIRETVAGDMNIIIEISAVDTNTRSEIVDLVLAFFSVYAEETNFSFLGDSQVDTTTGVNNLYQIILQSKAVVSGETDQPRPGNEGFDRIYYNKITVPIIFIDYVDRPAQDINVCFNSSLRIPDDDFQFELRNVVIPFPKSNPFMIVNSDTFEADSFGTKWLKFNNPYASIDHFLSTDSISGNGSIRLLGLSPDQEIGGYLNNVKPGVVDGKIRTRFNLKDGNSALVLFAMLQGSNPLVNNCYQLIVKWGEPSRLLLVKGPISTGTITSLVAGSEIVIPKNTNLAAQLEWKRDVDRNRILLTGYVTNCDSMSFGALQNRVQFIDKSSPYLTSVGEGVGFRENPDISGSLGEIITDDSTIIGEIGSIAIDRWNPVTPHG